MAGYKSHMAFGIITGAFWAGFLFSLSMISIFIAPLILFITVLGSFLPDLDSDSGRPIKVLLNILSIVSTAYAFFLLRAYSDNFLIIILLSIACYVFTYFIIGKIIKKLTHHRGMFHSIPAALLCFFFSMYILETTNISENYMILFSLSLGIGYLSHLILDETNSIVNLEGIPFIPKKSLGTAIKLYSKDLRISLVVYLFILLFSIKYYNILLYFFQELKF
jgi:membrane-bound metal-dependent hydrolase YbcI (DUF457 family)